MVGTEKETGADARIDKVRTLIECATHGDAEGAMATLHPNMVFHEAEGLPYPGDFVGREGFLRLGGEVYAAYDLKVDSYKLVDDGSRVISQMQLTATSKKSGRSLATCVSEFYSFTDGMISDADIYYKDTRALWELATNG